MHLFIGALKEKVQKTEEFLLLCFHLMKFHALQKIIEILTRRSVLPTFQIMLQKTDFVVLIKVQNHEVKKKLKVATLTSNPFWILT